MESNILLLFIVLSILSFLFGASIGSFIGVIIDRVPRRESIVWPPSHCDNCKKQIQSFENIPVISYLMLGGQCRYCKAKIPAKFFYIELICGILALIITLVILKNSLLI